MTYNKNLKLLTIKNKKGNINKIFSHLTKKAVNYTV